MATWEIESVIAWYLTCLFLYFYSLFIIRKSSIFSCFLVAVVRIQFSPLGEMKTPTLVFIASTSGYDLGLVKGKTWHTGTAGAFKIWCNKKCLLKYVNIYSVFSSELLTVPAGRLHVVSRLSCFNDYFQVFDIQHGDVETLQASTINHSREAKPPFSLPFSHL